MRKPQMIIVSLVCLVASSIAVPVVGIRPAWADNITQRRDQVRRKEAQLKIQIDLATATDKTVEQEAHRLGRQVIAEQAALAGARSALSAAQSRVAESQRRLDKINASSASARHALVARAVELYEHPFQRETLALSGVSSIAQYAERDALIATVQRRTSDILDGYRQQRIDEVEASRALVAARTLAERSQADVASEEGLVRRAAAAANATDANLRSRIALFQAESKLLAAQEATLEAQLAAASVTYAPALISFNAGASRAGLIWPLHGPVTSEFGARSGGFHPGMDIAPPFGTPIGAAAGGVVIFAGSEGAYGNYTCINHGGGISTCYAHQSSINVSVGQTVSQRQVIGRVGSTGNSTGPHLHFEVRVNNAVQNPRSFIGGNP